HFSGSCFSGGLSVIALAEQPVLHAISCRLCRCALLGRPRIPTLRVITAVKDGLMLRKEQKELLTQTGPGTSMGRLFRCYWLPALLSEELPENDCPPVRVKLLSERLLAFRDSAGGYGLIDEFCAHRGVSLWFGRNEEGGLRCPYHGWKY